VSVLARCSRTVTIALILTMVVAACGSSTKSATKPSGSDTTTAASCGGAPIRLMSITSLEGPEGELGPAYDEGLDIGEKQANAQCKLGRPLKIDICDDMGGVNGSLACGRKAKSEHDLAVLGSVGTVDDGVEASGLPGIFLNGVSQFELTNPKAYSSVSGLLQAVASVSAVKALGKSKYLMVLPDLPSLQFVSTLIAQFAKLLGVKYSVIFYPSDTSDFAPIAAEIENTHPVALGEAPTSVAPYVSALAADGITPKTVIMSFPASAVPPDVVSQEGNALEGAIIVSETISPDDASNPGIAAFLQAAKQYSGSDKTALSFLQVLEWSNVQRLVGALEAEGPAYVKAVSTPQQLEAAVVAHPISRPESAPYNFAANSFPQLKSLQAFRLFTRNVAILELKGEKFETLSSGFIDPLSPPKIKQ
jgi:hypothetical protein